VQYNYIRKDQDDDFIWLFYQGNLPDRKMDSVSLTNILLLDLFEDQTNLVIVTCGALEQGYSFNYRVRRSQLYIKED
jgi:hypothetical protein